MDLSDVFEFSQAYVALSRIRNTDSLFLTNIDFSKIKAHKQVVDYYNDLENKL